MEELVVYYRDILHEYIINRCSVVLGWDACMYGEPAAFIFAPQTCSLKLVLGGPPFKKETVNWPGYGLLQLNLKH